LVISLVRFSFAQAAPAAPQGTGVYEEDFTTYTHRGYTQDIQWDTVNQHLSVARPDTVEQTRPGIAPDGQGGNFVAWLDDRAGEDTRDLYVQRLDADGNRLWDTEVKMNPDGAEVSANFASTAWSITADKNGNVIIVWVDDRVHWIGSTYAQKLDGNGNKLWAQDVSVDENQGWPDVAVDDDNHAFIVWRADKIYAQKFDGDGNELWPTPVQVNDGGTRPAVAVGDNDHIFVVWEDRRNEEYSDGNVDIYAQALDADGHLLWAEDVRVNSDSGTKTQFYPAVTADSDGDAIVVWLENPYTYGEQDSGDSIYAQKLSVSGVKLWTTDIQVTAADDRQGWCFRPLAVMVKKDKCAVILWSGYSEIYAQVLDSDGERQWTEDLRVDSVGDTTTGRFYPALALDAADNWSMVWEDERNGNADIYSQRFDADGNRLWPTDLRVNVGNGMTDQADPAMAVAKDGQALVAWTDWRNGDADIYAQWLDESGAPRWDADLRVNADMGRGRQENPAMGMDAAGNTTIGWLGDQGGDWDIYVQRLDASGNKLWLQDVPLNTGEAWDWDMAVDPQGYAVVVWGEDDDDDVMGGTIYAQRLDPDGNKLWPDDLVLVLNRESPSVELDEDGNAVVVWTKRHGYRFFYAQRLDTEGNQVWDEAVWLNPVGTHGVSAVLASVGVHKSGDAVVTWVNYLSDTLGMRAQRLDPLGNELWGDGMTVNAEEIYEGVQHVTKVDNDGHAFFIWNGSNICIQKLGTAGNRLWSTDKRVNIGDDVTYAGWGEGLPAAGVDEAGNIGVAWEGGRSNADIYAQRLDPNGDRLWTSDVQIVDPDRFYLPNGLAQSREVDTTDDFITAATLTAQYVLQGGSVAFDLSNDGGAHWAVVTPGVTHSFTTTGSDLRWRVRMTADPVWRHRAPIVESLRIAYETTSANGDTYEPDDTCAQAQPIQVNGGAQRHTFHQQGDADWAWFDAVAGTTYIVQTANTAANADTILEVHDTCAGGPPAFSDDNAFGTEARVTFAAPATGKLYVKVVNADATATTDTGYDLMVRTFTQAPVAVIVGGHDNRYSLQDNIDTITDMAYRTLLNAGVPKANIRYFSPNQDRDVDGDGVNNDIYATATVTQVRDAIQNWARDQGVGLGVPFYVVLADHGHYDQFLAAGTGGRIWAADLNLWLSNLEATSGADNVNVIFEACKSGSFIDVTGVGPDKISGHNRVVIASTSSTQNAYPSAQGAHFSGAFWTAVGENQDLKTAFERGKRAVQQTGLSQVPWLDDNGDAVADAQDGALAQTRGLGGAFAGTPPVIDWVQVGEVQEGQAAIQAQVRDDFSVTQVRLEVYPPDFVEPAPAPDETTPVITVPTATLTLASGDVFSTTYAGFTQTGQYRLVVYAQDDERNQALPQATQVGVGCVYVYLPLVLRQ
jgi:hypothetical protein